MLLLLFAFGVLTATLMFVTGGFGPQDDLPSRDPRSDEVLITMKPVRLDPVTRQVELLVSLEPPNESSPVGLSLAGVDGEIIEVALPPSDTIVVTAQTNPQAFPDDLYRVEFAVTSTGAPVTVSLLPNPGLVDWRMSALDGCGGCVGVVFSRQTHVRLFVYGVALAPLLLGLSAALHWLSDRNSRSAPIELGAALLALLPLRDVLVPDDIPGITRLDHLLGGEVVLIAVAVAVVTAITLWRRATAASPADPPTTVSPPPPSPDTAGQGGAVVPSPRAGEPQAGSGPVGEPPAGSGPVGEPLAGSGPVGEDEADVPEGGVGEGGDERADRSGGDRG